ncbi:zinc ribbon domain-containing protein [Parathermosynechococcus lividus]
MQQAKATNQAIAIEYLTGIRERTNELPRSKTERRCSNSWALYQLRQSLAYKGVKVGVAVKRVAGSYTSKTCHCCNVIGHRQGKRFACLNLSCG